MPDPDPTPFTEDLGDVALALGLHPKQMRTERSRLLVEGAEFEYRSNRCFLSPAGVEKLRAALLQGAENTSGRSDGPAASENAAKPRQEAAFAIRKARVVSRIRDFGRPDRQHFQNPRVIQVEFLDGAGEKAFARVSHSRNYAPRLRNGDPMVVDVVWDGTRWEVGGRSPRFPGRW